MEAPVQKITADNRRYPARPIVGVGGLIFDGPSILLIKRGKEPGKGLWSIPGGALKTGETLSEGVAREIEEEVGLIVEVGPLVEVVERIIPGENGVSLYHYVILDYLCRSVDDRPPRPGTDAEEARFVSPENWAAYKQPDIAIKIFHKALALAPGAFGPL
ncbi:MAG: NUDIX hydrolase [Pseudomonadota bacterium]